MNAISPAQLLDALQWRYATKQFDASRSLPAEVWTAIESALVLTPSSYGLQPWKFLVVTDPDLKQSLLPHSYNQRQVVDCSHLVVLAARKTVSEAFIDLFLERTIELRGVPRESLTTYRSMMLNDLVHGPRAAIAADWAARQVYIALGNLMTSCALLGVDTCPIEGFVPSQYDAVLRLENTDHASVVVCALGYRLPTDKHAGLKKVRFPVGAVVDYIS
jgi:nitroreductase